VGGLGRAAGGMAIFVKTVAAFFVAGMWRAGCFREGNWKDIFKEKKIG
jgi:hypothetical protein